MKRKRVMHKDELELEDSIRERWYIIKQRSKFREYWDYLVMTVAIYNTLWTPLTISFEWAEELALNNELLKSFETVVLMIYTVDIII